MMTADSDALDHRRRKLKFRAWHRGTKEMDYILGSYADRHLEHMSQAEMDRFSTLLEVPDGELYKWVAGTVDVPAEFDDDIMHNLKSFSMKPGDFNEIG